MMEERPRESLVHLLLLFLRLGCIAFGGPVAHLAVFRRELIERRGWLDDASYADLIAFCQFLPGPASSQVGMGLGLARRGIAGMLVAWLGFTLPSAVLLTLLALGLGMIPPSTPGLSGALRGLHAAVLAVVAMAIWGMAEKLCGERIRRSIALLAAVVMIVVPDALLQLVVIGAGGLAGWLLLRGEGPPARAPIRLTALGQRWQRVLTVAMVLALLLVLAALLTPHPLWHLFGIQVQTGALVFGGGHVVLPLLEQEMVPRFVDEQTFLAGYGLTQAMPGPIFTFSAFLGAAASPGALAVPAAALALVGIFLPSFFLVAGLLPLWDRLRGLGGVRAGLAGVAAAVVGLLLAACWDPIALGVLDGGTPGVALALALLAFCLLAVWQLPAWAVVPLCGLVGAGLEAGRVPGW